MRALPYLGFMWALAASSTCVSAPPGSAFSRTIEFAGHRWGVKSSGDGRWGPGPNWFSSRSENVQVDERGRLHLRITREAGRWYCAEVVSRESFGYGRYIFRLAKSSRRLDQNAVLGLFTWSDRPEFAHREIDIEVSRWGDRGNQNSQFVVQPHTKAERIHRFDFDLTKGVTNHQFTWRSTSVDFEASCPSTRSKHTWEFSQDALPEHGDENVRMNLWLFRGQPPASQRDCEVVIETFRFQPVAK